MTSHREYKPADVLEPGSALGGLDRAIDIAIVDFTAKIYFEKGTDTKPLEAARQRYLAKMQTHQAQTAQALNGQLLFEKVPLVFEATGA